MPFVLGRLAVSEAIARVAGRSTDVEIEVEAVVSVVNSGRTTTSIDVVEVLLEWTTRGSRAAAVTAAASSRENGCRRSIRRGRPHQSAVSAKEWNEERETLSKLMPPHAHEDQSNVNALQDEANVTIGSTRLKRLKDASSTITVWNVKQVMA
jgi:hypothetical protein